MDSNNFVYNTKLARRARDERSTSRLDEPDRWTNFIV